MSLRILLCAGFLALSCTLASAQDPAFKTPGMPFGSWGPSGQVDRFSNEFNPAVSLVFDVLFGWSDFDGGEDGLDLALRSFELGGAGHVDPDAWAFVTITADEEEIELEEAAVVYTGLPGRHELRAGRFFVDFGKQMQGHVHELRTIDRPLVLREYLGAELAGTGVQWDNWFAPSDTVAVRWSLGVFQSLAAGHGHGDEEGDEVEIHEPGLKGLDELAYTARLTGFTDVGERGTLQLGASARYLPDFEFEAASIGAEIDGNSNAVLGFDLTYGWQSETGGERFATGGELLWYTGDLSAEIEEGAIEVFDGDVKGWYAFAEYGWNPYHSVGAQWSFAELPDEGRPEAHEYDVYYTWHMTELRRLRFGVTFRDSDEDGDSVRLAVQFTNFLGVHSHGVNW